MPTRHAAVQILFGDPECFGHTGLICPSARWPGYRLYMQLKVRNRVDCHSQDGPMKAVTLRSGMSMLTFLRPWKLP